MLVAENSPVWGLYSPPYAPPLLGPRAFLALSFIPHPHASEPCILFIVLQMVKLRSREKRYSLLKKMDQVRAALEPSRCLGLKFYLQCSSTSGYLDMLCHFIPMTSPVVCVLCLSP